MSVRTMRDGDVETVRELMRRLWSDSGDNDISITAHLQLGYRTTTKLQFFKKDLTGDHP